MKAKVLSIVWVAVFMLVLVGGPSPAAETTDRVVVTVAAVGDIVCRPGDRTNACKDAATANLIRHRGVGGLFTLGDNQYEDGTLSQFQNGYDSTYGPFKPFTYPSPGNHEYHTPGASGYFDYFGSRARRGPPGYYAFTLNGWRVYSLNTNCDKINCAAQRTWMVKNVAANPALCQAMYMHYSRYSSDTRSGSIIPKRFWTVGVNNGFELALGGHDHYYERFARMNASGDVTGAGMQSFVVGTGGKDLDVFGPTTTGSRARYSRFGVLFLTLSPIGYKWDFRTITNTSRDSGSRTCR